MAISISWLWLKTRGRDQTSISPRPTSLADPLAACRFASKPESSHQRWRGTGPERSGFQYIEIPNILVRQPALSCRNREQRAHRSEEHTSELQSLRHLVCRLLLEKKKIIK